MAFRYFLNCCDLCEWIVIFTTLLRLVPFGKIMSAFFYLSKHFNSGSCLHVCIFSIPLRVECVSGGAHADLEKVDIP